MRTVIKSEISKEKKIFVFEQFWFKGFEPSLRLGSAKFQLNCWNF